MPNYYNYTDRARYSKDRCAIGYCTGYLRALCGCIRRGTVSLADAAQMDEMAEADWKTELEIYTS